MNLFDCLLVGHFVGDYLLQNRWMADNKASRMVALLVHSLVYTITIYAFSLAASPLPILMCMLVLVSHCLIDQRGLTNWLARNIYHADDLPWFKMMIDQVLHILILFLIVFLVTQGILFIPQ